MRRIQVRIADIEAYQPMQPAAQMPEDMLASMIEPAGPAIATVCVSVVANITQDDPDPIGEVIAALRGIPGCDVLWREAEESA